MIKMIMILSNALGALGIISLIRISKSRKLSYFQRMKSVNTFFIWLILSNLLFYIYFASESLLYNLIVVNAGENIEGSAGGYLATEEIANNYFSSSKFLTWVFLFINITLFLFGTLLKRRYKLDLTNERESKATFTIVLIMLSLIACFVSLLLVVFLLEEFTVTYGG